MVMDMKIVRVANYANADDALGRPMNMRYCNSIFIDHHQHYSLTALQ